MRTDLDVKLLPAVCLLPGRSQVFKYLTVHELITRSTVKALCVAILPRTGRLDIQRLHANLFQPFTNRLGDEFTAVVTPDILIPSFTLALISSPKPIGFGLYTALRSFPVQGIVRDPRGATRGRREAESGAIASLECVGSLGLAGSRPRVVSPYKGCFLASPSPVWSIFNRQRTRLNPAPACGGKRGMFCDASCGLIVQSNENGSLLLYPPIPTELREHPDIDSNGILHSF